MKILRYMALLVAALVFGSSGVEGANLNTIVSGTFNGHEYKLISDSDDPHLSWPDANISVGSLGTGWYLATITSQEENNFVSSLIYPLGHAWLGGYQPLNETTSSSNWTWVTGETFSYTNWDLPWEPNDWNAEVTGVYEQYLVMLPGGEWNDGAGTVGVYIAERSPVAPVPIPGALILFGSGLLGLVGIGRRRMKK